MKKFILVALSALALYSCAKKPVEIFVPKGQMEFAGSGFDSFSPGADVRVYMSPDQDNPKLWNIQAVVPVRKETDAVISALDMELTLLDENGLRVRDSFSLQAEEMENLVPVFNSAPSVEKAVVFSVPEVDGGKKRFPYKQAKSMIEDTKGARLSINSEIFVEEETKPEDIPYTLPWLCKRTGVNGLLNQYRSAVNKKDLRKAGQIEAKIYQIEKDVKNNDNYPENLRKRFLSYVENKIEDIDDKY